MSIKRWTRERLLSETSYWRACILLTAAHLGLFTWIGKGAKSPTAAATRFGGNRFAWETFLNSLCAMGLMRKHRATFANTSFSSQYLSGPQEALLLPGYDTWQTWGDLAGTLTSSNRPDLQKPFLTDGAKTARLLYALDVHAREIAPFLIHKLSLARCRTLLDLGGGLGAYSVAFCRRYPELSVTLVEHPKVCLLARRAIRTAGMAERITVAGIDFSRFPLPRGFDAIFVSNALHAQGSAQNRSLLRKLHRSLNPGGQLIVRDLFMNAARTAPEWSALFSVALLLQTPQGRCYALAEFKRWLRQAGFSRLRGPWRSSPLPFDVNALLIATKQ